MISFASFPSTSEASGSYGTARHHPDVEEDVDMDMDDDDFEEGVQRLTVPGEYITSSHAFMRCVRSQFGISLLLADSFCCRGHGTYVDNEDIIASVAGTVERVNKLITVRAVRTRYALCIP